MSSLRQATAPHLRPAWRGRLHSWAFLAAIPAGASLIAASDRPAARVAAVIYATSLLLAFGISAGYHRLAKSERAVIVMQRLDHAAIYILIAGTYTPVCLVALPARWGIPLLAAVGSMALLGIALKLTATRRLPWLGYALYPIMGWAALGVLPVLLDVASTTQLALLVSGGVAYTIGFPILLVKRPDPWPKVFGYHEVFHALTVVAAGLHFVAIRSLVI